MRYRAALSFALSFASLLTLLLAIPAPAMAQHRADWMQEAKWGVMTHYLADWQARVNKLTMSVDTWNGSIGHFDVEALAKQLQSVVAAAGSRHNFALVARRRPPLFCAHRLEICAD